MAATRIDLGLAPPVTLGRLTLHPAVRTIRRDDGADEVIEPRMMQVLLALVEAPGEIVRREELTERCWGGRVVGEDAINRVLSRLRRVADGIGLGSFRIETITRVGYRVVEIGGAPEMAPVDHPFPTEGPVILAPPVLGGDATALSPLDRPSVALVPRRTALFVAAGAGALAFAGGGVWLKLHQSIVSAPAREAIERGMNAFRQMTLDQLTTAAAAFHEATTLAPGAAEPWGLLALVYRWLYSMSHGQEAKLNSERARDAASKALSIDADNGNAQATLATLQPEFRNWLAYDAACKPILARHPDQVGIGMLYIDLLSNTGQIRAVNILAQHLLAKDQNWPSLHFDFIISSWCLGRLDDADAAMDRAFALWPRLVGIWFLRQRLLTYSGRAAAGLAMVEDIDHRPTGLPGWDFDLSTAESRAILSRSSADIDVATALYWQHARTSVGVAVNAVQFFAAVGRLDDAFTILNALYFNRGFDVGERFFAEEQGTFSERRNRATWLFWTPTMTDLRADPRTAEIMQAVNLSEYWRRSGIQPDFPIRQLKSV